MMLTFVMTVDERKALNIRCQSNKSNCATDKNSYNMAPEKSKRKMASETTATTKKRSLDDCSDKKEFSRRDVSGLYCHKETSTCAVNSLCTPCAYKIGNFDIAFDTEFTSQAPNQRPEGCPRILEPPETVPVGTMGYYPGMNVLLCGDGDFSYSLAIARILTSNMDSSAHAEGSLPRLVATSYESNETLMEVYPNFVETLQELTDRASLVHYSVDATQLKETLPESSRDTLFDRIVWNFPCTAVARGQDGQNEAMEENKDLIRRFAQSARHCLAPGGEIHICHKTKPPFNQWKLEDVVQMACENPGFRFLGRVVLDRALLPPYVPRKALDKKSFPCHDACIYIFGLDPNSPGKFPPTIHPKSDSLIEVTPSLLTKVRNAHLIKARYESYNGKKRRNKKAKR